MNPCPFAQNLLSLRHSRAMTQEDLAAALSVSPKTVSKWETGASFPDLPTLAAIATHLSVSADSLLGIAEDAPHDADALFAGMKRNEAALRAFQFSREMIPALFRIFHGSKEEGPALYPTEYLHHYRCQIATSEIFTFSASSPDTNLAVTLLPNQSDFAWMTDGAVQEQLARLFALLGRGETIRVLHYLHSADCSVHFTADHVAARTGLDEASVKEVLDELCAVSLCHAFSAHLDAGDVTVYESYGDGLLLSILALSYEQMCGTPCYDYNYNASCKPIRGGDGT